MIDVERIVPQGVLCLYTAWQHFQLTTTIPSAFCIAIDAKRKMKTEDGVTFDVANLRTEPTTIDRQYSGTRFFVTATMDTIVYSLNMDIGFGDVVTPAAVAVDFSMLLKDVPSINIQAYSLETVVAEKFLAMVVRDVNNSRMKDFFDCYQILMTRQLDSDSLYDAIKATFNNRGLEYNPDLKLFTKNLL